MDADDISRAIGAESGATDAAKLKHVYQLTGFSDPVYAEASVTVRGDAFPLSVFRYLLPVLCSPLIAPSPALPHRPKLFFSLFLPTSLPHLSPLWRESSPCGGQFVPSPPLPPAPRPCDRS